MPSLAAVVLLPGLTVVALGASVAPANAAPLPATYKGETHQDIGAIHQLSVGTTSLLAGELGHSSTGLDSVASPRVHAKASNLNGAVAGTSGATPESLEAQVAGPDAGRDAESDELAAVSLAPLLQLGAVNAGVVAEWPGDAACLPAGSPYSSAEVDLADGAVLASLDVGGTGVTLARLGATLTTGNTTRVGTSLVSESTASTAPVEVLLVNGIPAVTAIVNEAVLTSTSTGTGDGVSTYNDPLIELRIDSDVDGDIDQTTNLNSLPGRTFTLTVPVAGLATADLTLTGHAMTDLDSGLLAEADVASVLGVAVSLTENLVGTSLASLDLGVLPMHTSALAPTDGIECDEATVLDITSPEPGSLTNDNTPTISGTGEPGSSVVVTDEGGAPVCTATVAADGTWSCTASTQTDGQHTYTATATDRAGNTATDSVTLTVDSGAPTAPTITGPADGSTVTTATPVISGTGAEEGSTVIVRDAAGEEICRDTTVGADGAWSCTPETPLPQGEQTINARALDAAGNTSPVDTQTFTVDSVPPTAPTHTAGDGITGGAQVPSGTGLLKPPAPAVEPAPDRDGLTTEQEKALGTNPNDADSDDDGLTDGQEVNGMVIVQQFKLCGKKAVKQLFVRTDPLDADTDGDKLKDGLEVKGYKIKQVVFVRGGKVTIGLTRSNPTKADTDMDGLKDKVEKTGSANKKWKRRKSDPTKCDTDRGGAADGFEVKWGSDPSRVLSGPNDFGHVPNNLS